MGKTLDTELVGLTHAQLLPAPDNLRGTLTDVTDLADSIAQAGVLQPLRVHPHPTAKNKWEIIAGHRRHAAVGRLIEQGRWRKTDVIPCVVDATVDDQARLQAMLIENLQRVDLDPIEEARGYDRLHSEFGHSVRAIAELVGRSKSVVAARTALLKLPDSIQQRVSAGTLAQELAGMMTRLPADRAESLATRGAHLTEHHIRIAVGDWERDEFTAKARTVIGQVGLPESPKPDWQLHNTYQQVHFGLSPAQLGKVILPDDTEGWVVTIDAYRKTITVWAPDLDRTATRDRDRDRGNIGMPPFDTNPVERLEADVRAWNGHLHETHRAADRAYKAARDAKLPEIARQLAGDKALVAASAIHWLCSFAIQDTDLHYRVGFEWDEDSGLDEGDVLDDWLTDTANQYAVAALYMAEDVYISGPVSTKADELLTRDLGTPPETPGTTAVPASHQAALAFYESLPDSNSSKAEGIATFTRLATEDPDNTTFTTPTTTTGDGQDGGEDEDGSRPCACGNPTADGEHYDDACVLDHDDDLVAIRDEADLVAVAASEGDE